MFHPINCNKSITNKSGTLLTISKSSSDELQKVQLVKDGNPITPSTRGLGSSNFPVQPPIGGRPVSGVNPTRTAPTLINQGLGGSGNPAGAIYHQLKRYIKMSLISSL